MRSFAPRSGSLNEGTQGRQLRTGSSTEALVTANTSLLRMTAPEQAIRKWEMASTTATRSPIGFSHRILIFRKRADVAYPRHDAGFWQDASSANRAAQRTRGIDPSC